MPSKKSSGSGSFIDDIERELFNRREVHLTGTIDSSTAYVSIKCMRYLASQGKKPITFYLNTGGGSVYDGLSIYDHIKSTTRIVPVNIIASGACMSMGMIIMQAATKRLALPNTGFLLHELQSSVRGSLSNMKDDMAESERLQQRLDEIVAKRSGQDIAKLRKTFERKDYFFDAQEALKFNLIDEIVVAA